MYKGETACRRKIIYVLLVNDTLLVNESPPTTENGALYQSIVGNTLKNRSELISSIQSGFLNETFRSGT